MSATDTAEATASRTRDHDELADLELLAQRLRAADERIGSMRKKSRFIRAARLVLLGFIWWGLVSLLFYLGVAAFELTKDIHYLSLSLDSNSTVISSNFQSVSDNLAQMSANIRSSSVAVESMARDVSTLEPMLTTVEQINGALSYLTAMHAREHKQELEGFERKLLDAYLQQYEMSAREQLSRLALSTVSYLLYLARDGDLDRALSLYQDVAEANPEVSSDPGVDAALCYVASLRNRSRDVLAHCERAVADAPRSGAARTARGIARAMSGNLQSAAEDLRQGLQLASSEKAEMGVTPPLSPTRTVASTEIEQWAEDLGSGRNPFDAPTLESLRHPMVVPAVAVPAPSNSK